jgi:aspartyl-tRNA(Asn)/glutamyl-tRNA(Gln) amidotransferase subunit A
VSRYGLIAFGSSLDVVGVIGNNVRDVALTYWGIAGHDPLDSTTAKRPVFPTELNASPRKAFSSICIGVPDEYFKPGIQPDAEAAVRDAINLMRDYGAQVKPVSLPHTEYALPVYYLIAPAEASANLARYDGIRYGARVQGDTMWEIFYRTRGAKFGAEVKRRIMLGTYALSAGYYDAYYGQAQKVRTLIKKDFELAFKDVDIIAAPTAPTTAFRIGEHVDDPLSMYLQDIFTLPANLAGIPGISMPAGSDKNGLPIGIQLMGPAFGENILFNTAHAFQQLTDYHLQKPIL